MNIATEAQTGAEERLRTLARRLEQEPGFADVLAALQAGRAATLDGVRGSSCALIAASLAEHAPGPLAVVVAHPADIDEFCDELSLFTTRRTEKFPAWETMPAELVVRDEIYGDRMRLLKELGVRGQGAGDRAGSKLIVCSIQSLLQPVPPAELLARHTRRLTVGETI